MNSFAFSFSAISLFFLPVWIKIFSRMGSPFYNDSFLSNHMQVPAVAHFDYAAGIITIGGLSFLLGIILRFFRTRSEKMHDLIVSGIVVALVLFAANIVRIFLMPSFNRSAIIDFYDANSFMVITGIILLGAVGLIISIKIMPLLVRCVLIGLPVGVVSLANAAGAMWLIGEESVYHPSQQLLAETRTNKPKGYRVVWIILDEFDYRLGFEKRPDDLDLKNLDYLADRSFAATASRPPDNGTFPSVPSLLIGETIVSAEYAEQGVRIRYRDSSPADVSYWRSAPSIFSALNDSGLNSSALGQDYIPYCRVFGKHLSSCVENNERWPSAVDNALLRVPNYLTKFLALIPVINRNVAPQLFDPGWNYRKFLQMTKQDIVNPDLDLVYVHWMLPHTPYVYDRKSQNYIYASEQPNNYFGNMALADLMSGEMLDSILESTVAARTAVIISSDHHWRRSKAQWDGVADYRVPFIVMLPGLTEGYKYDAPFNTVLTRSLIEAIIEGRIRNYENIADFIKNISGTTGKKH